ncbi:unnamed protein product [Rotaria magnacalcarata]|uniref:Fringe-like glycosyltransferase domain-containing protein n=2 Tax=Rotaria magnacalcarata TaxID=392030 RepID=A0A816UIT4_9BILA|nr:unnamed protein product [Rotaria magnacalcarata]
MRGFSFIVRKYCFLWSIMISILILIYLLILWFSSCASQSKKNNNTNSDIYSYFKVKSSNVDRIPTTLPTHGILLVIRTSNYTQRSRMPVILKTWFQFSPDTTYITTNGDAKYFHQFLSKQYHDHLHSTKCKQAHVIRALCCHSASEFQIYFENKNKYRWLCRFDDDQYVNVPLLIHYLKQFSPDTQPLYIGKPSMQEPKHGHGIDFWFATYGGGVCFSRSLLEMIHNDVQPNENFMKGCISTNYPDDTHIAYILRVKYNINLTVANDFHHHIERNLFTNLTSPSNIDQAITLGFKGSNVPRFVPLVKNDVFHMQTLHCLLYPDVNCTRLLRILINKFYEDNKS